MKSKSVILFFSFFFSSRRRHTRYIGDWSSDVCSSDLERLRIAECIAADCHGDVVAAVLALGANPIRHPPRSEERRVGKECRCRWLRCRQKKKRKKSRAEEWDNVNKLESC